MFFSSAPYRSDQNPEFRKIIDLLFLTDRKDIDLTNYPKLFQEGDPNYVLARFDQSSQIDWGEGFWQDRLNYFLSLRHSKNGKELWREIENKISTTFKTFAYSHKKSYNREPPFVLWLSLTKIKVQNKYHLPSIKQDLRYIFSILPNQNTIQFIDHLVPIIYSSYQEVIDGLIKELPINVLFRMIRNLEENKIAIDQEKIYQFFNKLILKGANNQVNRSKVFRIIASAPDLVERLVKNYTSEHKENLTAYIKKIGYRDVEANGIKNIIGLDSSFAPLLIERYIENLLSNRPASHKSNAHKISKLIKEFPQFTPRQVLLILVNLSSTEHKKEIKYLTKEFPELKGYSSFL